MHKATIFVICNSTPCNLIVIKLPPVLVKRIRATTHPNAFEELKPYCATVVVDERIVDEREVVTAQGVTSSIDLGLYLVERIAGREARVRIAKQMDYPYTPLA